MTNQEALELNQSGGTLAGPIRIPRCRSSLSVCLSVEKFENMVQDFKSRLQDKTSSQAFKARLEVKTSCQDFKSRHVALCVPGIV